MSEKLTLLALEAEIQALTEKLAEEPPVHNPDTGEVADPLYDALFALIEARNEKIDGYHAVLTAMEAADEALKARIAAYMAAIIDPLRKRRVALERARAGLRERLAIALQANGGQLDGNECRVRLVRGAPALDDLGAGFPVEMAREAVEAALAANDREKLRELVGSRALLAAAKQGPIPGYAVREVVYPKFTPVAGAKNVEKA